MNILVRSHINNAIKITETQRYRLGINEFIGGLIDNWAFEQTCLYPPHKRMGFDEEAQEAAKKVSHELAAAMRIDPVADVLGWYLSETGFSKDTQSFYPTPPSISRLMASLLQANQTANKYNHYEICAGTAILTLSKLDVLLEDEGAKGLNKVNITLEDINPLILKCAMLHILFYLDVRKVSINSFKLECVDSLSRKAKGLIYLASRNDLAA